jgi:hypothetical protein
MHSEHAQHTSPSTNFRHAILFCCTLSKPHSLIYFSICFLIGSLELKRTKVNEPTSGSAIRRSPALPVWIQCKTLVSYEKPNPLLCYPYIHPATDPEQTPTCQLPVASPQMLLIPYFLTSNVLVYSTALNPLPLSEAIRIISDETKLASTSDPNVIKCVIILKRCHLPLLLSHALSLRPFHARPGLLRSIFSQYSH